MTSPVDAGERTELVDRLVAPAPGTSERSVPSILARVARIIDAASGASRPPTALVLPRLDELAGAASSGGGDDELVEAVAAAGDAPDLLGQAHEALLDAGNRRRRGAFYTPSDVAKGLVADVFDRLGRAPDVTVCDPALGGGVFLLAAARELVARGVEPRDVVERALWGSDVDPLAVAVSEASLILWARAQGTDVAHTHVVDADPLLVGAGAWPGAPVAGFTAVVGNPPFLNQLGSGTSRPAAGAAELRARWGPAVFRYTDTSAVFLLAATELAAPRGVVAMIVPVPILVTADADRLRRELLDRSVPEHLWIGRDDVFGLGVRVCAPVLRVRDTDGPDPVASATVTTLTRTQGRTFEPIDARTLDIDALRIAGTWGELVADRFGVPAVAHVDPRAGRLGDLCTATAGFRDQYYGLRPFVVEAGDRPTGTADRRWAKLVTSGLIDPARNGWGHRTCRFDGRRWLAPVVDRDRLEADDPSLAAWAAARLVPKVVVATQTRVLEAAVDVDGDWFPSVPTIAVVADAGRLWDAAAVVLAPPTSAWAMNRHVGAALSADALKVSAKQLLDAPLPTERDPWRRSIRHLQAASTAADEATWRRELEQFGEEMTRAYAAPRDVLSWWLDRLPRWR